MGWNAGYTIFEATVVGAYDLGKLDKDLLRVLMEPYRGSDIDSGGERGLVSRDGLNVREIVIKTWRGKAPKKPDFAKADGNEVDRYWDELEDAFRRVTSKFDW